MTDDYNPPEYEEQDKKVDSVWPELKRLTDGVKTKEEMDGPDAEFSYPISHKLVRYLLAINRQYCDIERKGIQCPNCKTIIKAANPFVMYEA